MFSVKIQVDYVDTDAMAVAHHASYFRWFERARVEWMHHLKIPYNDMETAGYLLPLRSTEVRYLKPLRFDDRPTVEIYVEKLRAASIDIGYRIVLNGDVITTGMTSHVLCTREHDGTLTPVKIPEKWRAVWLEQSAKKPSK